MQLSKGDDTLLRYRMDFDDCYVYVYFVNYGPFINRRYNYLFNDILNIWKINYITVQSRDDNRKEYEFDILLDDRLNVSKIIFSNGSRAKRVCKIHRSNINNKKGLKGIRRVNDLVIEDSILYPVGTKEKYRGDLYYYDSNSNNFLNDRGICIPSGTGLEDDSLFKLFYDFYIECESLFYNYFNRKNKRPRSFEVYSK